MKPAAVLSVLLFFVFLCGCITVLPARKEDDGSTSVSAADSLSIHDFKQAASGNQIDFAYITASDIKKDMARRNYTVVEVWASWCSHCYLNLSGLTKLDRALKERNSALFLVSQNINVPVMQKQLTKVGFTQRSYIIDPKTYGTDETQKQIGFCKELAGSFPYEFSGSVPVIMIFDGKGVCKKVVGGEHSAESIIALLD